MLFACGHPAIKVAVRASLMLQFVLGFDAARIARVFAVEPAAMAQRLVRARAAAVGPQVPQYVTWSPKPGGAGAA